MAGCGGRVIVVWWVVVAAALGAGAVVWQLVRFPGGRSFAFGAEHREARTALDAARRQVRQLRWTALRETVQARAGVQQSKRAYRSRVRGLESAIARLRSTDRGALVEQFGGIGLYEGALLVGGDDVPLAGARVRVEVAHAAYASYMYVTAQDGRERMERYAGSEFPEDTVRRFAVRIQNASVAAGHEQARRAGEIRAREAELSKAREATGPMTAAQQRLEETRTRHRDDPALPRARAALDDARDTWHDLTGRRPY
ncbi:hypothetical protein ACWGRF_00125 [Streptomyces zhihengii]